MTSAILGIGTTLCNRTAQMPRCKLQVNLVKMAIGQAEQDPNLPCSASNVLGRVLAM